MQKIFIKKVLCVFFLVSACSCSLVEKTRRHFLGDTRPSATSRPAPTTGVHDEAPVSIGQNANPENSGIVVSAIDEKAPDATVPELANPNAIWVFESNLPESSGASSDLAKLQTALELYSNKQWDGAMGQLRTLVQSPNDQVQVRARYYAGKILQYKSKHQLALQVFEQVVQQNGYSSLALLAVKEAAFSAKAAQIKDKEIFYQTSLDDLAKQAAIP